jgi:hypothetical protein
VSILEHQAKLLLSAQGSKGEQVEGSGIAALSSPLRLEEPLGSSQTQQGSCFSFGCFFFFF